MVRIIVEPASRGNDLSARFVEALILLNQKGTKLQTGTKLVSKYVVIVAEEPSKALEYLRPGTSPRSSSDRASTVVIVRFPDLLERGS